MENPNNNEFTKEVITNIEEKKYKDRKSVIAGEEVVLDEVEDKKVVDKQINDDSVVKNLISKKILIGIICIVSVILCIVVYSIVNITQNKMEDEEKIEDESGLVSSVEDKYEGLNYSLKKEKLHEIGFFYDYSRNLEGNKIDVSFLKVDGLKDSKMQTKINDLLKETAISLYNENSVQDKNVLYEHIYNYTDVYIFNNVLSTLYCKEECDIDGNIDYNYIGVNVNLNKFEAITFKNIFLNTTNIEAIMTNNMKEVYNSQDFQFSISPKFVYIPTKDGKVEKISLYDNREEVAIYKRYSDSKKLFEKTYFALPYVFTTKRFSETDLYGMIEDNLFIDTYNVLYNNEYNDKIKAKIDKLYKDATNKARNLAYSNSSKRYLVQIVPKVEESKDKIYNISVEYNAYEIEKEFFTDSIIDFVVASENNEDMEYNKVDYDNSSAFDSKKYVKNVESTVLTLKIDDKENDVKTESNDIYNQTMGIS